MPGSNQEKNSFDVFKDDLGKLIELKKEKPMF